MALNFLWNSHNFEKKDTRLLQYPWLRFESLFALADAEDAIALRQREYDYVEANADTIVWFEQIFPNKTPEEIEKLKNLFSLVYRWGWFCFDLKGSDIQILRQFARFSAVEIIESWKLTDIPNFNLVDSWKILWRLKWDGDVTEHSYGQLILAQKYVKLNLGYKIIWTDELYWEMTTFSTELKWRMFTALCIASLVHDLWELAWGDVLYNDKLNAKNEWKDPQEIEKEFWIKLLKKLWATDEIINYYTLTFEDDKSHFWKQFKQLERMSYMTWMFLANNQNHTSSADISHNVLCNQIKHFYTMMQEREQHFNQINHWEFTFLYDHIDQIEASFALWSISSRASEWSQWREDLVQSYKKWSKIKEYLDVQTDNWVTTDIIRRPYIFFPWKKVFS